jgi:hypothetical protein
MNVQQKLLEPSNAQHISRLLRFARKYISGLEVNARYKKPRHDGGVFLLLTFRPLWSASCFEETELLTFY